MCKQLDDALEYNKRRVLLNFTAAFAFWGYIDLAVTCPVVYNHQFISKICRFACARLQVKILNSYKPFPAAAGLPNFASVRFGKNVDHN